MANTQAAAEATASGIASVLLFKLPPGAQALMLGLVPAFAFFDAPMLWVCLLFVFVDSLTGVYKAHLSRTIRSRFFGKAVDRFFYYVIVYVVLHALTLTLPLGAMAPIPEVAVLTGYLLKEALSILENLKAILSLRGQESPVLDALIHRLGLDLENILEQVEGKKKKTDAGKP